MSGTLTIAGGAILAGAVYRLFGHLLFRRRMEFRLEEFGIDVRDPERRERIVSILQAFFTGYNTMVRSPRRVRAGADRFAPLYHPFYHEGAAMGYSPRLYLGARARIGRFEETMTGIREEFIFLYYIGLGFWYGFRHFNRPERVTRGADRLQRFRFKELVHDGYGFKLGMFHYGRDPGVLRRLERFDGFARNAAYMGVGRSLWFVYMDRPERIVEACDRFGEHRLDAYSGFGLATAYTYIDRLDLAYDLAREVPDDARPHFEKGIRVALFVRDMNDRGYTRGCLDGLGLDRRRRAQADLDRAWDTYRRTLPLEDFYSEFHGGNVTP